MKNALKERTRASSDAGRTRESKDEWYIYTAHYPKSLTKVPLLRMIICDGYAWIVAVTDVEEKKGKIIADCDPGLGEYGPYFSTHSYHRGHSDLCRHLQSYGVGGDYKKYVAALDEGKKALADELSGTAMIRFSTRMTKDKLKDWDIDMSFWEGADKQEEDETEEDLDNEIDPEEEAETEEEED